MLIPQQHHYVTTVAIKPNVPAVAMCVQAVVVQPAVAKPEQVAEYKTVVCYTASYESVSALSPQLRVCSDYRGVMCVILRLATQD
jgi:hypothetical protein